LGTSRGSRRGSQTEEAWRKRTTVVNVRPPFETQRLRRGGRGTRELTATTTNPPGCESSSGEEDSRDKTWVPDRTPLETCRSPYGLRTRVHIDPEVSTVEEMVPAIHQYGETALTSNRMRGGGEDKGTRSIRWAWTS
jgi:hypothetical protein